MTEKKYKKQIPMTKEFNQKNVNDWIYGYFQSISYVDNNNITFVYKSAINQTELASKAPLNDSGKQPSKSKISRDIQKLIKLGFIKETKVVGLQGNLVDAYELPFEENQLFKFIPLETLIYLLDVGSQYLIKIYVYLLNKFQWKVRLGEYYNFTYKELITECLGMKSVTNTRDYTTIRNCLDSLIKQKFITLDVEHKRINGQLTTYFKLISVNLKIEVNPIFEEIGA